MEEPSRPHRPECCERCGWVTRNLRQVEGKYLCPECRGEVRKENKKESRLKELKKLWEVK